MTHHILQPRSQGNVMRHKVWKSHAYVDFNCGKWWAPAQPTSQAVSRCASSMASAKAPLGRNFHLGQVQALCPFHPLCCVVPKIIRISVSRVIMDSITCCTTSHRLTRWMSASSVQNMQKVQMQPCDRCTVLVLFNKTIATPDLQNAHTDWSETLTHHLASQIFANHADGWTRGPNLKT